MIQFNLNQARRNVRILMYLMQRMDLILAEPSWVDQTSPVSNYVIHDGVDGGRPFVLIGFEDGTIVELRSDDLPNTISWSLATTENSDKPVV